MSRKLGDNCTWVLKLNGETIEIGKGLDPDLDSYLLNHLKEFNDGGATLFSLTPQESTVSKVDNLKKEIDAIKTPLRHGKEEVVTGDDPEESDRAYIQGTIGVNRATTELPLNGTDPLVTGLTKENFKSNRIKAIKAGENLETIDGRKFTDIIGEYNPERFVELEMDSWSALTEYGEKVHKIFEDVFKEKEPSNPGLPETVFNSLKKQVFDFKSELKNKFGSSAKFYSEFLIQSKDEFLSENTRAVLKNAGYTGFSGIIDLLIIDEHGNGHIFDFKVSRKNIAPEGSSDEQYRQSWFNTFNEKNSHLWHSTKKLAASYQTEIYKHLCEMYNIPINDTTIIPIKLDLEYKDDKNPFLVSAITGAEVSKENRWIVNPIIGTKEGRRKINNLFVSQATETADDVEASSNLYNTFWPLQGWNMKRDQQLKDIKFYKENSKYVKKIDKANKQYEKLSKEGKTHQVKFPGESVVYCKESEIDDILQQAINRSQDTRASKFMDIADGFETFKESGDLTRLKAAVGAENHKFILDAFKRYIDDDAWKLISDNTCHSIGIMIFRKGDKIEIVCISNEHLQATAQLAKGTSILGQTKDDKNVDMRKILPALKGNLALMKGMIYVSQHQELFKNARISEIRAIAPWHRGIHSVTNEMLLSNYRELIREHPASGAKPIEHDIFMSDFESLVTNCEEELENLNLRREDEDWYSAEWFLDKIKYVKNHYSDQIGTENETTYQDTPAGRVLAYLYQGYLLARGFKSHIELDKGDVTSGHWYELNGLIVASPQYSSSANIRELGQAIDEYAKEVRRRVTTIGWPMKVAFENVYKKYGYGAKIFRNWFADTENLILKDPDCGDFDSDLETKEALRCFLKTMCKLRHPDYNEEQLENAKDEDEQYYAIPLLEAKFSRQVQGVGIWKAVKNKFNEKKAITENLFGEEVQDLAGYGSRNQEIYNKLRYDNMLARQNILDKHNGAFETDLELVMNAMLVSFCRSNVSKEYIPVIAGLKLGLDRLDALGGEANIRDGKNMKNIRKRFDDIVKSKFYGDSLIPKDLQPLYRFLSMVKSCFTTLSLSLNTRSFLRESLQGIYAGIIRSGLKLYPGINEKSYIEGLTYVIKEARHNFSSVSMLQQMNELYGMANQSLTQIANNRRLGWANIHHWGKSTLFITATAPDFMHRMSLLVAKMKSDGCWEAHSTDETGKMIYDFKKDGRFQHLINGDISNPEYLKEKAIYETMIDGFNQEGFRKEDGSKLDATNLDALPQAYTRTEAQSIKNYADLLYGHYDEESKSLLYDNFLGSFFLQYKTYLTSRLEQWTMHKGQYNVATLKQMKDANGDEMYVKFYDDEEGNPHKDILLKSEYEALDEVEKNKCRLYYDYEGLPMQGMLQETVKVYKALLDFATPEGRQKLKEAWADPTTRTMFKLQWHDLFVAAMLTWLVTFLFGTAEDVDEPLNAQKVRAAVRKAGPLENFTYSVITGSLADSQLQNILGSFTDDPPTVVALQKFGKTTMGLLTGDYSIAYWITKNIGALGDFQGMAEAYNKATE